MEISSKVVDGRHFLLLDEQNRTEAQRTYRYYHTYTMAFGQYFKYKNKYIYNADSKLNRFNYIRLKHNVIHKLVTSFFLKLYNDTVLENVFAKLTTPCQFLSIYT